MVMVKIDGAKVKRLREQKGLTQLYVATAVQVTTDTISRWENKRYPSVKKENCSKLAEALGVALEDILEQLEIREIVADAGAIEEIPEKQSIPFLKKTKPWLLYLAMITILIVVVPAGWFFFLKPEGSTISAQRILPRHCLPGQPFPVVIEVKNTPQKAVTLILREMLPSGAVLKKASPSLSTSQQKDQELKWLEKIEAPTRFIYTITLKGKPGDIFNFSGNIAVSQDSENLRTVVGSESIEISTFHWADTDGDNTLNDKEMLAVHDRFNTTDKLGIDLDLIEKIWLGSGYRWNAKNSTCEILP